MMQWATKGSIAMTLALFGAACDGAGSDDGALATIAAAYTEKTYDPPLHDEKSGADIVWSVDFESADDVLDLSDSYQCGGKDDVGQCFAVEPALSAFDELAKKPKAPTEHCSLVPGNRRPWGRQQCRVCCVATGGWPALSCTVTCF